MVVCMVATWHHLAKPKEHASCMHARIIMAGAADIERKGEEPREERKIQPRLEREGE